jgi:hypothetical protein
LNRQSPIYFFVIVAALNPLKAKTRHQSGDGQVSFEIVKALFLPSTLLVAVGFQALPALMLRHLQPTFLFQIAHGIDK